MVIFLNGARGPSSFCTRLPGLAALWGAAAAAVLVACSAPAAGAKQTNAASSDGTVTVSQTNLLRAVPKHYIGLSIDPANLCYVVQLARTTPAFVQLVKNLGPGTLRVGGNTGDEHASWSATATSPTCKWNALVMTPGLVRSLFAFAQRVGYRVMWQVPLDNGKPIEDAAEAAYVSTMPGLYSIEIGNEPNYYYDASSDY